MNLSPLWVSVFKNQGWKAVHWSTIGDPRAADTIIMNWARQHHYIVFTHDLDFGTLLAITHLDGPSVIQVRTEDVMPDSLSTRLIQILLQYETTLDKGALITVDETKNRLRILHL